MVRLATFVAVPHQPRLLQNPSQEVAMVCDAQAASRQTDRGISLQQSSRRLCRWYPLAGALKADRKLGKLGLAAVDRERTAVLLGDDVPADREPQAGAFAGRLGR